MRNTQYLINLYFNGRNRCSIVPGILQVIDDLMDYLPLTVRQVYYQLVVKEIIYNHLREYQNISRLLTRLREKHLVPWSVIIDRSRRMIEKRGISTLEEHIRTNMGYMFDHYNRCLVQNQENYVEVWTEKDALTSIFEEAVWKYCCRIVACRGQVSSTFLNNFAIRAKQVIERGQTPVILYFGDLDPTGMRIPEIIKRKLMDRYDLFVDLDRIALWPDHVKEYALPFNPEATKKQDPNYKWYCRQGYGDYSVELDALHPKILIDLIDDSLLDYLDIEDMEQQENIQDHERRKLKRLKMDFLAMCDDHGLSVD